MELTPWRPFRSLDDFFGDDFFSLVPSARINQPAMDIYETDTEVVAQMELPGMSSDDVEVVVEDGYVKVRGERKEEKEEGGKEKGYWRREIRHGAFERMAHLPVAVDEDNTKADFEKGVLTVHMPKTEPVSKGKKVEIEDKD